LILKQLLKLNEQRVGNKLYNWNDILILGDSFACHRDLESDWPMQLSLLLSGGNYNIKKLPRGIGYKAGAWWAIRLELIKELISCPPKVLIICHPYRYRIPNDWNFGLGRNFEKISIPKGTEHIFNENIREATKMYYENIFCKQFFDWATENWFKELDELLLTNQIEKVIHIKGFSNENHVFNNGVTIQKSLKDICLNGLHRNHFDNENNVKIAQNLYKLIKNFPENSGLVDINLLEHD
jgi:hypothetical protein